MNQSKREELAVQQERTMLVGVLLPGNTADPMDPLGELRSLARTAGADVVDEIVAKRGKPHPGLYIGTGKAKQIADRVEQNEIECLIFDNDLSPGQIRDLENIAGCKVLDRSELILDIFATHAQTHQSRLQVELAQLEYTYPRLTGMWQHLDRHGGAAASAGGMGTRGPGETQIETDRRLVLKRVGMLKRKLTDIDRRKLREVRKRGEAFCVCLVGYTNAGKSTLMNLLTGAETYVADQLFATLETKTRRWNLNGNRDVLLSDTVGFVRDLPHHLVASFRATLEEAIHADLLIHVADASHERVDEEIRAVNVVLDELGCDRDRLLLVLNKIDKIVDPTVHTVLRQSFPQAISLSAVTGRGAETLLETVRRQVTGYPMRVKLHANYRNGKLMHYIAQHADVEQETYDDATACIQAVIAAPKLEQLRQFGDDVVCVTAEALTERDT
jgi:GTP-binding protein HflX